MMRTLSGAFAILLLLFAACDQEEPAGQDQTTETEAKALQQKAPPVEEVPPAQPDAPQVYEEPTHRLEVVGEFHAQRLKPVREGRPEQEEVAAEPIDELNSRKLEIIQQVLERHGIRASEKAGPDLPLVKLDLGLGRREGTSFRVTIEEQPGGETKKMAMMIPFVADDAELITNFDHSLDRAVRKTLEK